MQRLVDHAPGNPSPLVCVLGAENYEINRNSKITQSFTKPHELRSAALQLGLDDEQIQVAIGTTLASGARAKKNYPRSRCGVGQATACLLDKCLVIHQAHRRIVVAACDGDYPADVADASDPDKAAVERRAALERTRGMFAHLAPGESLTDELIADRRMEAHAEDREAAEDSRRLRGK